MTKPIITIPVNLDELNELACALETAVDIANDMSTEPLHGNDVITVDQELIGSIDHNIDKLVTVVRLQERINNLLAIHSPKC